MGKDSKTKHGLVKAMNALKPKKQIRFNDLDNKVIEIEKLSKEDIAGPRERSPYTMLETISVFGKQFGRNERKKNLIDKLKKQGVSIGRKKIQTDRINPNHFSTSEDYENFVKRMQENETNEIAKQEALVKVEPYKSSERMAAEKYMHEINHMHDYGNQLGGKTKRHRNRTRNKTRNRTRNKTRNRTRKTH